MRKPIILAAATVALFGCGEPPAESTEIVARPVKSILVAGPAGGGVRNFPGRVESSNRADLGFRVRGTISALSAQEGAEVSQGQVLARLDQRDFEIALKDRQATWDRANKDFSRGKELIASGAISRRDFDLLEANFKTEDAALDQAKQNLDYTFIRAPFAGQIARRHVDNYEEVRVGQTVYSLIDRDVLEVEIDVPENIILSIRGRGAPGQSADKVQAWASFDEVSDRQIPLTFKEASTRADEQTQTFPVTFSLARPEGVRILPGMTSSVTLDMSALLDTQTVYYLPIAAVVADKEMSPRVWTVDETDMTVRERKVQVGSMVGSSIEVTEGLEPGLRVITAGAAYLSEGMKVRLLKQSEQAESRKEQS